MTEFTDHQLRQLIENAHEHRWARTLRVLANELLQVRKQCYLLTGNETNTTAQSFEEENERLRTLVRSAYHEGWVDGALNGWVDASNLDTSDADWARSETRNALAAKSEETNISEYAGQDHETTETESLAGTKLAPWQQWPLDEWAICGMNHYHQDGTLRLFVSMTKDGRCITEEGADDISLWNRLREKALATTEGDKP